MKKYVTAILIILSLGALSWAQGTKDPFDVKKSREELEIMKGILNTTISFIGEKDSDNRFPVWGHPEMDAFYLADQGAVFVIPISSRPFVNMDLSRSLDATRQYLDAIRTSFDTDFKVLNDGQIAPELPAPPAAPAPPSPPAPPAAVSPPSAANPSGSTSPPAGDREELKKRVEEFRAKTERIREEELKRQEKLHQSLAEIKTYLVEALANYGDSLTTVKPDEQINLVLTTESLEGRQKGRFDIISARKSWITDYKAGRLSLDAFKQKVLQYTQ